MKLTAELSEEDELGSFKNLTRIFEQQLGLLLLKLENIFHVPTAAVNELVDELHFFLVLHLYQLYRTLS